MSESKSPAKKAAAKKSAASPAATDKSKSGATPAEPEGTDKSGATGTPLAEGQTGDEGQAPHTGRQNDSGPGTGVEAPKEETARYPSTVVNLDSDASPIDPPADAHTQVLPEAGYALSSTDPVYTAAGGSSVAGEDFHGLVDEDDNPVSSGDLFEDEDGSKTFVVSKSRVYEVFYYPNTTEKAKRLLWAKGRRVPRFQADRIKASLDGAQQTVKHSGMVRGDSGDRNLV